MYRVLARFNLSDRFRVCIQTTRRETRSAGVAGLTIAMSHLLICRSARKIVVRPPHLDTRSPLPAFLSRLCPTIEYCGPCKRLCRTGAYPMNSGLELTVRKRRHPNRRANFHLTRAASPGATLSFRGLPRPTGHNHVGYMARRPRGRPIGFQGLRILHGVQTPPRVSERFVAAFR
jgi:hypothetical protein